MSSIFPPMLIKYNLLTLSDLFRNSVNSSKYGLNSIRFFASKFWQMVPMEMKNLKSFKGFKNEIRSWKRDGCDCKLCKAFVFLRSIFLKIGVTSLTLLCCLVDMSHWGYKTKCLGKKVLNNLVCTNLRRYISWNWCSKSYLRQIRWW